VEWAQVPGANHFYSSESQTRDGRTVFEVIRDSIAMWVGQQLEPGRATGSARSPADRGYARKFDS
jgi:hypothetical protein